ncbi:hypothetical protein SAZ11_33135 [Streptomyces sp. FXJ1.4098]|nr:hypothetical protein [Streptomyces sp. FXJ1.4098]
MAPEAAEDRSASDVFCDAWGAFEVWDARDALESCAESSPPRRPSAAAHRS